MNKLSKVAAVLVAIVTVSVAFALNNVFAAGGIGLSSSTGTTGTATSTGTTSPVNQGGNLTNRPATSNTPSNNLGKTNTTNTTNTTSNRLNTTNISNTANTTINSNMLKDSEELPKTGEFDVYIISVVAVAVVLIGGFAFVKSRKIN